MLSGGVRSRIVRHAGVLRPKVASGPCIDVVPSLPFVVHSAYIDPVSTSPNHHGVPLFEGVKMYSTEVGGGVGRACLAQGGVCGVLRSGHVLTNTSVARTNWTRSMTGVGAVFIRHSGSFASMGIREEIVEGLKEMGVVTPSPIQAAVIPQGLQGRDVLLAAQTGTGKTLAYMIPIVECLKRDELDHRVVTRPMRPRCIVLTPSRELALQTLSVCKALSHHAKFRSVYLSGGKKQKSQKRALASSVDMLIATPGRLSRMIESREVFLGDVAYLVVDEADTMLHPQSGFGSDLEAVFSPIKRRELRGDEEYGTQMYFCVATMKQSLERQVKQLAPDVVQLSAKDLHTRPKKLVEEYLDVNMDKYSKHNALLGLLGGAGKIMVFCNTLASARSLDYFLQERGVDCCSLHGGLLPKMRESQFDRFLNGECDLLVCTDSAARGLDIPEVNHIVLFDFPTTAVDYLHRVGRTARAGSSGRVTSLVTKRDRQLARQLNVLDDDSGHLVHATRHSKSYTAKPHPKGRRRKGKAQEPSKRKYTMAVRKRRLPSKRREDAFKERKSGGKRA